MSPENIVAHYNLGCCRCGQMCRPESETERNLRRQQELRWSRGLRGDLQSRRIETQGLGEC